MQHQHGNDNLSDAQIEALSIKYEFTIDSRIQSLVEHVYGFAHRGVVNKVEDSLQKFARENPYILHEEAHNWIVFPEIPCGEFGELFFIEANYEGLMSAFDMLRAKGFSKKSIQERFSGFLEQDINLADRFMHVENLRDALTAYVRILINGYLPNLPEQHIKLEGTDTDAAAVTLDKAMQDAGIGEQQRPYHLENLTSAIRKIAEKDYNLLPPNGRGRG